MEDSSMSNAPVDAVDTSVSEDTSVESAEEIIEGEEGTDLTADAPEDKKPAPKKVEEKKSNKKKLKLKVDGKEFEEEIDLDNDDYLTKQLQLAKAAQKRMSEFSQLEKEVTDFITQLRKDPRKVLQDPRIGLDVKKLAAEIIEEEIQNSQKSPEQIEKETLEQRLKQLEEERKKEQDEFRQKEFDRIQAQEFERYDRAMTSALEKSDLPKSPYIIKKMADYMLMGIQAGHDVQPEDVLPLVREEMTNDLKEMFAVMPDEVIEALVGKDVIGRIRKKNIANAKAKPPTPVKAAVKETGEKAKSNDEPAKKSYKDFFNF